MAGSGLVLAPPSGGLRERSRHCSVGHWAPKHRDTDAAKDHRKSGTSALATASSSHYFLNVPLGVGPKIP
jgi:hypothetical protein